MSTLRLLQRTVTPPDKFRYTFPEDGFTVRNFSYDGWLYGIKKHSVDNGYPLPSVETCEDQLCRLLPPGWCKYDNGNEPTQFINTRFTVDDFIHGTKVVGSFLRSRDDVVSQELAESRAATCAACFANVDVPGCASCFALANLVAHYAGGRTTKADTHLKACGVCHCSNQAQVWIPAEHLAKGVTPEMMELYRGIEHCWKRKEIGAL